MIKDITTPFATSDYEPSKTYAMKRNTKKVIALLAITTLGIAVLYYSGSSEGGKTTVLPGTLNVRPDTDPEKTYFFKNENFGGLSSSMGNYEITELDNPDLDNEVTSFIVGAKSRTVFYKGDYPNADKNHKY